MLFSSRTSHHASWKHHGAHHAPQQDAAAAPPRRRAKAQNTSAEQTVRQGLFVSHLFMASSSCARSFKPYSSSSSSSSYSSIMSGETHEPPV